MLCSALLCSALLWCSAGGRCTSPIEPYGSLPYCAVLSVLSILTHCVALPASGECCGCAARSNRRGLCGHLRMRAGAALRVIASMVQRLAHGGWQLSRDELDVVFLDWFLFSRVN